MIEGLRRLPSFTVNEITPIRSSGFFDSRVALGEGRLGFLISDSGQCFCGRFFDFNPATMYAAFQPEEDASHGHLSMRVYRYADIYWGERIDLVLSVSRQWNRKEFKSHGNWDHEHCSICWADLSEQAEKFGYADQDDCWVCESCYATHVKPKDLGFIDEIAISQIRGKVDA